MCLLITQNKNSQKLSNEWLEDFYSSNSDGLGVMYAQDNELIVEKFLPKNAKDLAHFYKNHIAGRDCAYHFRMRTHGDIDLFNCHPYEVLNKKEHGLDLWLMHNGVLATGNTQDTSKSDTYHYIQNYLKPMLANNPHYFVEPSFSDLIGSHIGSSNKFVLMDNLGRRVTINEEAGVYWAGLWLSNTYAWSASKSASKTPSKSLKEQAKQAKEKPVKSVYYPKSFGSGYYSMDQWQSNNGWYDYYDYYEQEIDYFLEDLDHAGYKQASRASLDSCLDFVEVFGLDGFQELIDSLLSKSIEEKHFLQALESKHKARELVPSLHDYQYQVKGSYYA